MKVLVTGATGFIGKELIKKLNANGHEILVLTRNSDSASASSTYLSDLRSVSNSASPTEVLLNPSRGYATAPMRL